jgi:hypothetical protein
MTREEALRTLGLEGEPSEAAILDAVARCDVEPAFASTPEQQRTLDGRRDRIAAARSLLLGALPGMIHTSAPQPIAASTQVASRSGWMNREQALTLLGLTGDPSFSEVIDAAARLERADEVAPTPEQQRMLDERRARIAIARSLLIGALPQTGDAPVVPAATEPVAPAVQEPVAPEASELAVLTALETATQTAPTTAVPPHDPKSSGAVVIVVAIVVIGAAYLVWNPAFAPTDPGLYWRRSGSKGQCITRPMVLEVPGGLMFENVSGQCLARDVQRGSRIENEDIAIDCAMKGCS